MLGRTHIVSTTATGMLGLYGLHHAEQTMTTETIGGKIVHSVIDIVGLKDLADERSLLFILLLCLTGLVVGSLLPDIDSKKSILGRYVPFLEGLIGHRTFTHTIWAVILMCVISYFSNLTIVWMIAFGYLLHVIQDSFSKQGVAWLYPFGKGYRSYGYAKVKQGFHIPIYGVGSLTEEVIGFVMYVLNIWVLYKWGLIVFA